MRKLDKINEIILDCSPNFINKRILITGGNSGLGYSFIKHLINVENIHIVIASRNEERIKNAINELKIINPDLDITYTLLDLADIQSVKRFIKYLDDEHFDYIYLNAGVLNARYLANDISITYLTNFISNAMIAKKISENNNYKNSKIIYVSTLALLNPYKKIDLNFIKNKKGYFYKYSTSKYLMSIYYYNLMKNNPNFYLIHPGISDSNIFSFFPKILLPLAHFVVKHLSNDSDIGSLPYLYINNINNNLKYMASPKYSYKGYPKIKKIRKCIRKSNNKLYESLDNLICDVYKEN